MNSRTGVYVVKRSVICTSAGILQFCHHPGHGLVTVSIKEVHSWNLGQTAGYSTRDLPFTFLNFFDSTPRSWHALKYSTTVISQSSAFTVPEHYWNIDDAKLKMKCELNVYYLKHSVTTAEKTQMLILFINIMALFSENRTLCGRNGLCKVRSGSRPYVQLPQNFNNSQ